MARILKNGREHVEPDRLFDPRHFFHCGGARGRLQEGAPWPVSYIGCATVGRFGVVGGRKTPSARCRTPVARPSLRDMPETKEPLLVRVGGRGRGWHGRQQHGINRALGSSGEARTRRPMQRGRRQNRQCQSPAKEGGLSYSQWCRWSPQVNRWASLPSCRILATW